MTKAQQQAKEQNMEYSDEETNEVNFIEGDNVMKMAVSVHEEHEFIDEENEMATESESDEGSEDADITFKSSQSSNNNASRMEEGEISDQEDLNDSMAEKNRDKQNHHDNQIEQNTEEHH